MSRRQLRNKTWRVRTLEVEVAAFQFFNGYFLGVVSVEVQPRAAIHYNLQMSVSGIPQVLKWVSKSDLASSNFLCEIDDLRIVQHRKTRIKLIEMRAA